MMNGGRLHCAPGWCRGEAAPGAERPRRLAANAIDRNAYRIDLGQRHVEPEGQADDAAAQLVGEWQIVSGTIGKGGLDVAAGAPPVERGDTFGGKPCRPVRVIARPGDAHRRGYPALAEARH